VTPGSERLLHSLLDSVKTREGGGEIERSSNIGYPPCDRYVNS
jgi:hypothetical protein